MAIESSVKCDVCGRTKGETNNWPRVREDENSFRILKPHVKPLKGDLDICGAACLHSLVDRFWSGAVKAPAPEETIAA